MEFNDGSEYRVLDSAVSQVQAGRELYAYRAASMRGGQLYEDLAFNHHRQITAGVLRATLIYQFVYTSASPEAQADFFLQTLGYGLQPQEMVCLDLESGGGFTPANVTNFAERWLVRVEPALATKAWLYVPSALSSILSASVASDRIIWAPRYSGGAQRGAAPFWRHDVHQYTDRGFFPGCSMTGDTSYTTLTTEAMLARCNPGGFVQPPHGGPS